MTTSSFYLEAMQEARAGIIGARCWIPKDGTNHAAAAQSRVDLIAALIEGGLEE